MNSSAPLVRHLSPSSGVPFYLQLEDLLSSRVSSGEWAPGGQIPTESELSQRFGASRPVVRQALADILLIKPEALKSPVDAVAASVVDSASSSLIVSNSLVAPNCVAATSKSDETAVRTGRQFGTTPLWLNAHRPLVNGAQAARSMGMPTVAERIEPSTADERICGRTSSTAGSVQIGAALRYRLAISGSPPPSAGSATRHQATPNPSALIVPPPRMSLGAHAWVRRECEPAVRISPTATAGPR